MPRSTARRRSGRAAARRSVEAAAGRRQGRRSRQTPARARWCARDHFAWLSPFRRPRAGAIRPSRCGYPARLRARWLARANFSGGRSADITAGAGVWFHAARGMALRIDASPPLIPAHSASLRAFTPVFDGLWTRVNALMLGIQSPVLVLWVPATGSPRQQKRVYARL